jgi:phosphoribosylaminoimidazole (AIR) synthetase
VVAAIEERKLPTPAWMQDFLAAHGTTPRALEGVFNLGVGMLAVVSADAATAFQTECRTLNLPAHEIGGIERAARPDDEASVRFC